MVRDSVLAVLENNRGCIISGGSLAKQLGVSRTAIWKAISALKQSGFDIEAIAGEGYRLALDNDILTDSGIQMFLETKNIGQNLQVLDSVGSTNTVMKQQFADKKPEGFVLVADHQTGGRGRLGRAFHSPAGVGIYMSILLKPKLALDKINFLTIAGAVAVCKAIAENAGFTPQIKWVNDVLYDNRKLCGILTEASLEAETGMLSYIVLGIGINVHNSPLPPEVSEIAASLSSFSGKPLLRNQIAAAVLNQLEVCYTQILDGNYSALLESYKSHMAFLGQKITVHSPQETYAATALDINQSGHLVVLKDDGTHETLFSGEISIRL